MTYHVDRTAQLEEALSRSRFGSVASLRAAGTPAKQHNVKTTKAKASKKPAKKTAAKKSAATSKAVKTTAARKTAKKAAK